MFARTLTWDATPAPVILGQKNPIDVTASVTTADYGLDSLSGPSLWKLVMFGSKEMDGSGERRAEIQQILSTELQGLSYAAGETLAFEDLRAKFDMSVLGCDEFRYLCLEFAQHKRPNPDYNFFTEEGTPTLITCKRQDCQTGKFAIWTFYKDGFERSSLDMYFFLPI